MDLTEKLNLMGYSKDESKQLQSVEEVADFICKNGKRGDVTITNNGEPFITTIPLRRHKGQIPKSSGFIRWRGSVAARVCSKGVAGEKK